MKTRSVLLISVASSTLIDAGGLNPVALSAGYKAVIERVTEAWPSFFWFACYEGCYGWS